MEKSLDSFKTSEEHGTASRHNISFKVTKQSAVKLGVNKLLEKSQDRDFVVSVENKKIKGTIREEKKKPLVIQPVHRNIWRKTKSDGNSPKDEIDQLAVEEILKESAAENEKWEKRYSTQEIGAIPILMQNKIPDGFENDHKLDVSLRPEESKLEDYENVPVDQFGTALLRGLGCNPGDPVGNTNKKVVAPIEAVVRSKGLGLGADIKPSKREHSHAKEKEEELPLVKGACVRLLEGNHKGHYGKVDGLDESRVVIHLTRLEKVVSVPHLYAEVVSSKEYKKESKVLNRTSYDEYTKNHDSNKNDRHHRHKQEDILCPKPERHGEDHGQDDTPHPSKEQERSKKDSHKKRKHSPDRHKSEKKRHSSEERPAEIWVRPLLKVRFVDKQYKKGKYYGSKMTIDDVLSLNNCACKTEDGKYLEGINQSSLETVIPRSEPAYVMVVKGKHKGQLCTILKRDKGNCVATINFLSDRERVSKIDYDSICEYVGDVSQFD